MQRWHVLSEEEQRVILQAETDPPFEGAYEEWDAPGFYLCKQCDLPLFSSKNQCTCGCGWPSFDEGEEASLLERPDPDGKRVEVACFRCHAHLGHVFRGEHFTKKNTRYCINSTSLRFTPAFLEERKERAIYAGGCFWGVEYLFQELPILQTCAGYIGGEVVYPTYEEVCSGKTGHLEAVEILFDPIEISYETLTKRFFELHDPTQTTGQGPDIGGQYLSAIFYLSEKQRIIAEKVVDLIKNQGEKVATSIRPASLFYQAESYHQDYYKKTGKAPYCHFWSKRFH
ncbi:MAG: bifunctional methionine sulfoxide reductase B/A protein [Chlamydiota bacterium]